MPRPDYERFCLAATKELDYPYFLQTHAIDPAYDLFIAKVHNVTTTFIEKDKSKNTKFAGVFVDIFPIDGSKKYSSLTLKTIELKDRLYKYCAIDLYVRKHNFRYFLNKLLGKIINLCFYGNQSYEFFHNKREAMYIESDYGLSDVVVERHSPVFYDKKFFENKVYIDFEDIQICCPADYDKVLKVRYGDYMKLPPELERRPHHGAIVNLETPYTEYFRKGLI